MIQLFNTFLYEPLFNGLIVLYVYLPGSDLGVAIIVLTALVRLVLSPLVARQFQSQQAMNRLQPKIADIRKKVKDKQEQSKQLLELYKKEGVHPASGCLPLIVQLPVLIALYWVFIRGVGEPEALDVLYASVPRPDSIDPIAFGFLDLSSPNTWLAFIVGIAQFYQSKLLLPPPPPKKDGEKDDGPFGDFAGMMRTQMLYGMPVITVVIALQFPSGVALYWLTTTIFGIIQQLVIKKRYGQSSPKPESA